MNVTRPDELKVLHVVLVSPSDVATERDAAEAVITELNHDVMHQRELHLEVHRWEKDAPPALHLDGPQGLIDDGLDVEHSDLVIGILWSRFGTPTSWGETGTEHELRTAWRAWRTRGRPQVVLYLCTRPVTHDNKESAVQVVKVLEFLEEVSQQHQQLVQKYAEPGEFAKALRSHIHALIPLLAKPRPEPKPHIPVPPVVPVSYLDGPASSTQVDPRFVEEYRREMRTAAERDLPATLTDEQFLESLGVVLSSGELTRTGALLFGCDPSAALPTAFVQCVQYDGTTRTAYRRIVEVRGTVSHQITNALKFVSEATKPFESPSGQTGRSEVRSPFPTVCLREVIANAIVHRDYEDMNRMVHVRLFRDRVEIASPGSPLNCKLDAESSLRRLSSQSVKRNFTLARLLTYVRLVEGEGSGIPMAIDDARNMGVPEPIAREEAGYTTVTVFRRILPDREPISTPESDVEFADRRVATPLARVSLDMIVQATRPNIGTSPSLAGRETFGFDPRQPVVFFVPTLPRDPSLVWRLAVTAEDVLATRSVIQALLDRWPQLEARTLIVEPEDEGAGEVRNICAICREHRNPVTTELLSHLRRTTGTDLGFVSVRQGKYGKPPEWGISFPGGYIRESPSYSQEERLSEAPVLVDDVIELEDVAMIARFKNPWGEENGTKALVVAGARAFGTWGAAEYLRTSFDDLYAQAGIEDFVCRLRVLKKYRVGIGVKQQVLLFPTDEGAPTVELVDRFRLNGPAK